MGAHATIADDVDVYCVRPVTIGAHSVISQYSYLCGATHDFERSKRPLVPMPITIGEQVWIAADVFVAPGVTIGDGVVVGARSSVFTDLPSWKVCVGSPAKPVRDHIIRDDDDGNTEKEKRGGEEVE
jgi:putative colanic acid biosynthesis acetyltransferase WcaF